MKYCETARDKKKISFRKQNKLVEQDRGKGKNLLVEDKAQIIAELDAEIKELEVQLQEKRREANEAKGKIVANERTLKRTQDENRRINDTLRKAQTEQRNKTEGKP